MMRWSLLALAMLELSGIAAQPGWRARRVVFTLYERGVLVEPRQLQMDPVFQFRMDGREATPHRVAGTDRSVLSFEGHRSDPMAQTDTLWMEVVRGAERMRIAFPPPRRGDGARPYTTDNLHIDFTPGRFLVFELPVDVHLSGTVQNIARWFSFAPPAGVYLRCGDRFAHSGEVRGNTGRIDAEVACVPYFQRGRQWVDLSVELVPDTYEPLSLCRMTIKAPVQPHIDLQDFDFVPQRMVWNNAALMPDACLPRDTTVRGNTANTAAIFHPVDPEPGDTLSIELQWIGAGAPLVSAHRIVQRTDGVTEVRVQAALRTDVDLDDMSGPEQATPFVFTDLHPGRYVITQEPASYGYADDLDVLIGKEITVVVGPRTGCQE